MKCHFEIVKSDSAEVTRHFYRATVTSVTSMADTTELAADGADDLGVGEEEAEKWNGAVPSDAEPWNKALHRLISSLYGDGQQTGVEPEWWTGNDDIFVDIEEERRSLPRGALQSFTRQPYHDTLVTSRIHYGQNRTSEGHSVRQWRKARGLECVHVVLCQARC